MQPSLLATLALLPFVLSSAVPAKTRVGTTKIPLIKKSQLVGDNGVVCKDALKRQLIKTQNKLQRGFDAFQKNTGVAHPNAGKRLIARDVGNDPLTDDEQVLWQGDISVGTPPITFSVDFDTGSSDLFLPGPNCRVNCNGHTVFDTKASSTAEDQRRTFRLAFGDGFTVQGEVFHDTVTVAGLTATDQAVGAATQYSTGFAIDEFPPDGLMGMAFPQISVFEENPVFQTLIAEGQTTDPVFAMKLSTSGPELTLGGIDSSLFTGDITRVPVTEQGFWQINVDSANVNGQSPVNQFGAIVDSGTSLLLGTEDDVNAFYAAIPGARDASQTIGDGFFTLPCDSIPDDISLTLSGTDFAISPDTFNLGLVAEGSRDCVGGLVTGGPDGLWVLGDVFMENVYTVFDVGNTQVGFANLA